MADTVFRTEITAERAQFDATMDAAAQKSLTTAQSMQSAFRGASVSVSNSVKNATDSLNKQYDSVKAGIEKVRGVIAGLAVIVGGGAIFGKFVSDAAAAALETEKLSTLLGVTTQEASALRIALDDIGSNTETYVGALGKMTMKLREGEERFNELGVKTRGANHELLSGEQIMQNGLQALLKFKEGTDRNLASTELFGKGWAEMSRLLKLTPEAMEEARKKGEDLGLIIGPIGAARVEAYRRALNDTHDVFKGLGNAIAQVVMPVLTDFGKWVSDIGPEAVKRLRAAISGLMIVFEALRAGVVVVMHTIYAAIFSIIEPLSGVTEAVGLAVTGKFAAAADRLKAIPKNIGAVWSAEFNAILNSVESAGKRIRELANPAADTGKSAAAGGRGWTAKAPPAAADESQVSRWEAELAAQRDKFEKERLLEGSFQTFSKQQERDFWKEKIALTAEGSKERAQVEKKFFDAERVIRTEAFEREQADIKAQIEAHKQGSQERIRLAEEAARRVGEKYGLMSKEYRQAQADVEKLQREAAERAKGLQEIELESFKQYQLQRVALERGNLDTLAKLGIITDGEKLAALRRLKEIEFQIEIKAAEEKAELLRNDVVEYRKALETIEQLKRKHVLDMQQIDGQLAEENKKTLDKWLDPLGNAMEKMATGIIMGTQRWQDAVRRMLINIGSEYLALGAKVLINWVKTEILKTQASVAGITARTAAETTGSAASIASTAGSAIMNIGAKAWEAAAAVYASIAQIPFVGPFLAPVMAIAAAAAVLGFIGKIASAEGGFSVPTGLNPLTQLHEEEMTLPKDIANPLRESLEGGGGVGGGTMHVTIHAMDGASVERVIRNNPGAFKRGLGALARNFATKPR